MSYLTTAGPLVWPTLILAGVTLWFAGAYARRKQGHLVITSVALAVATMLMAGLSAVAGFQRSVMASAAASFDNPSAVLRGAAESMNGLAIALLACLVAAVIVAFGAARRKPSSSAVSA